MTSCARGCTRPRHHITDCEDRETCSGCLPRDAEHGLLCYNCHKRLVSTLTEAPGQHALLIATAAVSTEQALTVETIAKIGDGLRMSSDAKHQGPYARHATISVNSSEPVRLAALSAASDLADWLSEMVERIVDDYQARGPERLLAPADRDDPRRKVWRSGDSHTWDEVKTYGDGKDAMTGFYVWIDPPLRFEITTAAQWLLAQIERIEFSETVADDMETLSELMGQAHALAPWREQMTRMHGIPCPSCHRTSLVRYGGEDDVTCLTRWCGESITPQRYAMWVRMYADEQRESA